MAAQHEVSDPAFLLVREFDWWWTYQCERSKARTIARHHLDRIDDEGSPITGVLYVGNEPLETVDLMARKLNHLGLGDDKTYEERRQAAQLAKTTSAGD